MSFVPTNGSAGVPVRLYDLQLTQQHADMTPSQGQAQVQVQDVELLPHPPEIILVSRTFFFLRRGLAYSIRPIVRLQTTC